ncbi:MAG TPA: hypothetical protein PLM79_04440 [Syntrophobacteraceae bacterium]|nr:hypothetical protein [Syntrophobacteraceae bacterium]
MENPLVIRSMQTGFLLLDRILEVGAGKIVGEKTFHGGPAYLGIEALAQLGAYHVRFLNDFRKHAFLLKIQSCTIPTGSTLRGPYRLFGELRAGSAHSYAHHLEARREDGIVWGGEFLFSTVEYDDRFKKDLLQTHYGKIFSCLRSAMKTG